VFLGPNSKSAPANRQNGLLKVAPRKVGVTKLFTGLAALIAAVSSLLIALHTIGWIGGQAESTNQDREHSAENRLKP
jgi:hypothetical protein